MSQMFLGFFLRLMDDTTPIFEKKISRKYFIDGIWKICKTRVQKF